VADANTIIRSLGQQVAQLTVDKAILEAEVADLRERLEARDAIDAGEAVAVDA
jgi:hypothetical protein